MFLQKKSNNTALSLREITNGNINMKYYDYNDVVPPYLMKISYNDFSSLTPLHVPI